MLQKPSVGRVVHYTPSQHIEPNKKQPFPAIITHVHDDGTVNLDVFKDAHYPNAAGAQPHVPHRGTPETGGAREHGPFWDWPPFVPAVPVGETDRTARPPEPKALKFPQGDPPPTPRGPTPP